MKRIARWSTIFLLLCSIIWAGTASAAMIVNNNMSALNTLNTINNNQTPQGKDSALMRLAQEIGAGMWDNTDWDDPAFQQNIKQLGITVLNKDTQPPEAFIGDAIFDHLGDTEFNVPEMNGNLLVLGGLNANLPSGKIDRLYVLSDEDVRLNIGAAADVQELILGASGNVSLNGEGNVRSTIVVDKPMNLGIATNLVNLTDDPLPTGDIVLNPGKNALVPGQQLHMGSELKVEKKISLTVRFRLVDQSAKDMQLETADWDGALLTEATVQYTGDSCPMGAVNMLDSIEAAFAEKYPDLQEQYVLLPEMRSADPWSKVFRLNDGKSCFAATENCVYLSRTGDVVFPLTDDNTLVAEFPVYVYRYGEQDGRITYRVRISGARPDYFTPSLRSGAVASFTFDKERGEWVTQFKRSDFGADERALIHLTGLRGEETDTFLPVTGREERRIVTLTWTADTQRVTIDAQNVLWGSDMPAEGNDLLCRAGEQVTVQIAPAAGYRGIHVFLSDPAISLSISEGNDAVSFLMPYAPLTLTLTANKLYTVTLDASGGDPIRPIQYTVESEAFLLPTPVRTGYIFLGWTGEGITEPQKAMEIPQGSTGDRTYTANWQVIEYTVTLDVSGGDPLDPITYTVETPVILPTPTSTGYTFLGWTGEGETTPQPTVVLPKGTTGDKAYTANWKVITYTIALGANGGEDLAAISYTIESDPIKLPTPERKGYEFKGWVGDDIDGAQTEVIIPTGSTGDRTYIALWRVIAYFIELRQSSGNWMQNIPYTVEEEVKLPIPTREGYEFIGWVGEDIINAQKEVTIPRGSTGFRLYAAHWALENYTITLDTSGGNALDNIRYTVKSDPIILPTPTRNGYEFVGWTGEGITTPQTSVKIPTGSTGNRTYTANWKVIEYTITLDTNGGPAVSPIKYTVEDSFTLPYLLRTGYEFVGWTLDGSGMIPATPLIIYYGTTGDLHYKAEWRLAEYTITMDLDGGSGQEKMVYTMTDEDFELPTPTRNGYEFVGWTGERITTPQTSVKIPKGSTGNKAYTANWKVIRYTITLVTNGGAVIASIRYTVEDSVTLPIPPDRPGYEFAGWVLDGSGLFPSTPMIIPAGSTGDRIYKAEWRVATYTITYVSHGKAYNWVQYTINNQVYFGTPEEDPSYYLPGYTFVGWQIDGVSGTPLSYMLPKGSYGNRTATMLWEPIP